MARVLDSLSKTEHNIMGFKKLGPFFISTQFGPGNILYPLWLSSTCVGFWFPTNGYSLLLAGSIHSKVSGFYSSKQFFTNGQTVRRWLSTQSYDAQYKFGVQKLKDFGWKP